LGADRAQVARWVGGFAAVAALVAVIDVATIPGLVFLALVALALPAMAVRAVRVARSRERSLVRASGRLLLDGEPLELARVELRVLKMPVTHVPTGYALSLWVMTSSGPEDIPIGRFRTLLEAAAVSGQLEDFVQRANLKQHRLA
jgi:hypothetical protein